MGLVAVSSNEQSFNPDIANLIKGGLCMKNQAILKLHYPERVKWIDQQLKKGMGLADIFDLDLPESEDGIMSSRVNVEVMNQWREFTATRMEKSKDLFSMALCEFMINHR